METEPLASSVARAEALMAVRRHTEAAAMLRAAIGADPRSARPRCLLANCLLATGDYAGALEAASGAAGVDPSSEWAHRIRAKALLHLKRRREGLAAAREAVRLAPGCMHTHLMLSEAERLNRNLQAAGEAARRAVELDPDSADAHNEQGLVALRRRKYGDAEGHFRDALSCNPVHASAMNNLGVVLQKLGHRPQAIHCFAEASRLDPRVAPARKNALGAAKATTGVPAAALLVVANPALMPLAAVVVGGVLGVRQIRRRRRGEHLVRRNDPVASTAVIRQLQRDVGRSALPQFRPGVVGRTVLDVILFLVALIFVSAGLFALRDGRPADALVNAIFFGACVAGVVLEVRSRPRR